MIIISAGKGKDWMLEEFCYMMIDGGEFSCIRHQAHLDLASDVLKP